MNTQTKLKSQHLSSWLPHKGNVLFTLLALGTMLWLQTAGVITGFTPAAGSLSINSTNIINYQGYLADNNGNPVTGNVDMTFRIYNSATGGTPLWEETWSGNSAVTVTDGVFNVLLGSINITLSQIVQGQSDLYLGIVVGTTEITPRTQFGSAISSLQAQIVPDNTIVESKLADGAVSRSKIQRGAVDVEQLAVEAYYFEFKNPTLFYTGPSGQTTSLDFRAIAY